MEEGLEKDFVVLRRGVVEHLALSKSSSCVIDGGDLRRNRYLKMKVASLGSIRRLCHGEKEAVFGSYPIPQLGMPAKSFQKLWSPLRLSLRNVGSR